MLRPTSAPGACNRASHLDAEKLGQSLRRRARERPTWATSNSTSNCQRSRFRWGGRRFGQRTPAHAHSARTHRMVAIAKRKAQQAEEHVEESRVMLSAGSVLMPGVSALLGLPAPSTSKRSRREGLGYATTAPSTNSRCAAWRCSRCVTLACSPVARRSDPRPGSADKAGPAARQGPVADCAMHASDASTLGIIVNRRASMTAFVHLGNAEGADHRRGFHQVARGQTSISRSFAATRCSTTATPSGCTR